jgi:hypothetical protein
MDGLFILAIVLIGAWALQRVTIFVLASLSIHKTHRSAAIMQPEPFDPRDSETPLEVAAFFQQVEKELVGEGFVLSGFFLLDQNTFAYCGIFDNPATRDAALVSAVYVLHRQAWQLRDTSVKFSSLYSDEALITTDNSRTLGLYAPVPGRTVLQVPEIRDIADLYQFHREMTERFGSAQQKVWRGDEDPIKRMRRAHLREISAQVALGYRYLDENSGIYRLTWKGAFLMTLKCMRPISTIRRALVRRRMSRLLRR